MSPKKVSRYFQVKRELEPPTSGEIKKTITQLPSCTHVGNITVNKLKYTVPPCGEIGYANEVEKSRTDC